MGVVLVYDITDEASFANIENWMQNVKDHAHGAVSKAMHCVCSLFASLTGHLFGLHALQPCRVRFLDCYKEFVVLLTACPVDVC